MFASLLIMVSMTAAPSPRVLYETKCLYCHSAVVTEAGVRTPNQWRAVVASMRRKAPLLITRAEARQLVEYLVKTLKRVPAPSPRSRVAVGSSATRLREVPAEPERATENPEDEAATSLPAEVDEAPPAGQAAEGTLAERDQFEALATELLERRCSKCHTLSRVYSKLDTLERSLVTLRRMRLKPGSGIGADDAATIERFLRTQFETR